MTEAKVDEIRQLNSTERINPKQFKLTESLVKRMTTSTNLRNQNTKLTLDPIMAQKVHAESAQLKRAQLTKEERSRNIDIIKHRREREMIADDIKAQYQFDWTQKAEIMSLRK